MRKIREVLRLHHVAKLSKRAIGRSCGLSHSTVAEVLRRAEAAGLSWPLPEEMDDAALEAALYGPTAPAQTRHPMPDMNHRYRELRSRKGVTLRLLWLEYKQAHPDGYPYSRFCELYRRWAKTLDVSLERSEPLTPRREPEPNERSWPHRPRQAVRSCAAGCARLSTSYPSRNFRRPIATWSICARWPTLWLTGGGSRRAKPYS